MAAHWNTYKTDKIPDEVIEDLAEKLKVWIEQPNNWWLGEFAAEHKIHRQRFPDFKKRSVNFAKAYAYAKQVQENRLVKGGLHKKYDSTIVCKALVNVADWHGENKNVINNVNMNNQQKVINTVAITEITDEHRQRIDRNMRIIQRHRELQSKTGKDGDK